MPCTCARGRVREIAQDFEPARRAPSRPAGSLLELDALRRGLAEVRLQLVEAASENERLRAEVRGPRGG
jgi:hypothetical protein